MRRPLSIVFCLAPALMAQEAPYAAPKPGPEMAKLQAFVGTWDVEEVIEPGAMGPGGKGHGVSQITLGPGGFSLHIRYTSTDSKGPMAGFKGEGYLLWDGEAKTYRQTWVDSMAPMLALATCHWEGDEFVSVTEGTMMGKPFKSIDRFTKITPKGYVMITEASMDGGPMKTFMTLTHTRKK